MKRIVFKELSAQRIYNDYMNRVERSVAVLAKPDRDDVLNEINSHIYEGLQHYESSEVAGLLDITERLGAPEIVLKPLVADRKLQQATRSFRPGHVAQAVWLNLNRGLIFVFISLCCILIAGLSLTILTKILYPGHTGLFFRNGELLFFGFNTDVPEPAIEMLGNWYIPVVLVAIAAIYVLTVLVLRLAPKTSRSMNIDQTSTEP
jgi:hypothetical protein